MMVYLNEFTSPDNFLLELVTVDWLKAVLPVRALHTNYQGHWHLIGYPS